MVDEVVGENELNDDGDNMNVVERISSIGEDEDLGDFP